MGYNGSGKEVYLTRILNMEIPDWVVWLSAGLIIYELSKKREEQSQELEGDVMTCAAWQTIETPRGEEIRCMFYEPTCSDGGDCRTQAVPYPPSIVEMLEKMSTRPKSRKAIAEEEDQIEKEIKVMSQIMAAEANESLEEGKKLYKEILAHGGLRQERGGYGREEYREIPRYLHRKSGTTLDDMATEMGYKYGDDLYQAIMDDKFRRAEMPGGRKYYRANDFTQQAEQYVLSQSQAA